MGGYESFGGTIILISIVGGFFQFIMLIILGRIWHYTKWTSRYLEELVERERKKEENRMLNK